MHGPSIKKRYINKNNKKKRVFSSCIYLTMFQAALPMLRSHFVLFSDFESFLIIFCPVRNEHQLYESHACENWKTTAHQCVSPLNEKRVVFLNFLIFFSPKDLSSGETKPIFSSFYDCLFPSSPTST